jgi:[ribosomal protein S18]-alanine N-acetyltransferase
MIQTYTHQTFSTSAHKHSDITGFLFRALEQYGDKETDIRKCLDYALSDEPGKGGLVAIATENEVIVGAVIINNTGMSGYIPEHILVYIAVDPSQRGNGVGKALIQDVISQTKGNIALHVEPDNPARRLYERLGFTSKYLEMRLHKS